MEFLTAVCINMPFETEKVQVGTNVGTNEDEIRCL